MTSLIVILMLIQNKLIIMVATFPSSVLGLESYPTVVMVINPHLSNVTAWVFEDNQFDYIQVIFMLAIFIWLLRMTLSVAMNKMTEYCWWYWRKRPKTLDKGPSVVLRNVQGGVHPRHCNLWFHQQKQSLSSSCLLSQWDSYLILSSKQSLWSLSPDHAFHFRKCRRGLRSWGLQHLWKETCHQERWKLNDGKDVEFCHLLLMMISRSPSSL